MVNYCREHSEDEPFNKYGNRLGSIQSEIIVNKKVPRRTVGRAVRTNAALAEYAHRICMSLCEGRLAKV